MYTKKHDTLCWQCEKAGGNCSWSKNFTPVEGWKAIPTKIKLLEREKGYIDSFDVYECPEFELMELIKMQKVSPRVETRHIECESTVDDLLRRKYTKTKKERERE